MRARAEAMWDLKAAKSRVKALRRRPESRAEGRAPWGPAPRRGLAAVVCATPAQQRVCQEEGRAVSAHQARLQRLEAARRDQARAWRLALGVPALQARRGVQFPVAVILIAARGARPRVDTPRHLMSALGRTPARPPVASAAAQAASPTPAPRAPVGRGLRAPGPPAIRPRFAALSHGDERRAPGPSRASSGTPTSDVVRDPDT